MAKQVTVKNIFEGENTRLDKYDQKYLKYVHDFQNKAALEAFEAFRTKDLATIETTLKQLSLAVTSNMYIIGLGCLIIERERLYIKAGYDSYLEYAQFLFDDAELPTSTLSDAKIIMEKFIDYNQKLMKAGFKLERNANKLRFIDEALENHGEEEVFRHIVEDTFKNFKAWARRKALIEYKPGKDYQVSAEIKGDKLLINGMNVLNFPKELSMPLRGMIKDDLQKAFSIRDGGNLPYIVPTYDQGEQAAIDRFLKEHRSKK